MFSITSLFSHKGGHTDFFSSSDDSETVSATQPRQIACSVCVTVPTDCLFILSVCHRAHRDRAHRLPGCSFNQCITVTADCLFIHSVCITVTADCQAVHSVSVSPCPQIACSYSQCITVPTDRLFIQSVRITVPTEGWSGRTDRGPVSVVNNLLSWAAGGFGRVAPALPSPSLK